MARAKSTSPVIAGAKPLNVNVDSVKYIGTEPLWEGVELTNRTRQMLSAFNWYNYNFNSKDAKSFVVDYLTVNKRTKDAKQVKKVPDTFIPNAVGWMTRMYMMGWPLTEEEDTRIEKHIALAMRKALTIVEEVKVEETAEDKEKKKFNIQELMRERMAEAGGMIEGMLDDFIAAGCKSKHNFKPMDELKKQNVLPAHVNDEIKHWESVKAEFTEAHAGKDADLKEAYGHFTKTQLKNIIKFIDSVIADYHGYVAFKKATKKVRKRKVKTPVELARKLKFMQEFKELKLTSEKPAKIVGAKEMFAYDTKKRKLMYFVADEFAGELTIKNNTIDGFDPVKSFQKTVRKPEDQLKEFMKASKPATRKYFEKMKSVEQKFSGRFNENIVILKVW